MKRLKKFVYVALMGAMLLLLTACGGASSKSITFDTGTGDKVKVTLNTTDGLTLSQEDGVIVVEEGEETILQGFFIDLDMVAAYVEEIEANDSIVVLDQGEQNGITYVFHSVAHETFTEYDYLIRINDSNTGVLIGSAISEEKAKEGFAALSFSVE